MESLGVKRLAKPFLHSGGCSWGLPDLCLSSLPAKWYPHISEMFKVPSSYKLRALKDTKTVSQSPYHDHLFVYVDALKVGLRFSLHPFIIKFLQSSNLTITQLLSNSWAILSSFVILCRLLEIEPFVGIFRSSISFVRIRTKLFVPFMLGLVVVSLAMLLLHGKHGNMASSPFLLIRN